MHEFRVWDGVDETFGGKPGANGAPPASSPPRATRSRIDDVESAPVASSMRG
jgi:hypothetical protein